MDLKVTVAQMVNEEMGDCVESVRFSGPYEDEEFNVVVKLRYEPDDFEDRDTRLYRRVEALGYDIGIFVERPPELIPA